MQGIGKLSGSIRTGSDRALGPSAGAFAAFAAFGTFGSLAAGSGFSRRRFCVHAGGVLRRLPPLAAEAVTGARGTEGFRMGGAGGGMDGNSGTAITVGMKPAFCGGVEFNDRIIGMPAAALDSVCVGAGSSVMMNFVSIAPPSVTPMGKLLSSMRVSADSHKFTRERVRPDLYVGLPSFCALRELLKRHIIMSSNLRSAPKTLPRSGSHGKRRRKFRATCTR